jgi:hypothetical protein
MVWNGKEGAAGLMKSIKQGVDSLLCEVGCRQGDANRAGAALKEAEEAVDSGITQIEGLLNQAESLLEIHPELEISFDWFMFTRLIGEGASSLAPIRARLEEHDARNRRKKAEEELGLSAAANQNKPRESGLSKKRGRPRKTSR